MKVKNYYLKFKLVRDGSARVSAKSLLLAKKSLEEKLPRFFIATTIHTDGVKANINAGKLANIKKESK